MLKLVVPEKGNGYAYIKTSDEEEICTCYGVTSEKSLRIVMDMISRYNGIPY